MSDTPIAPSAPGRPEPGLSASPEQHASARKTWEASGLDVTKFDQAVSGVSTVPEKPAAVGVATIPKLGANGLSPDAIAQGAQRLLAAGMDPAKVAAMLAAEGVTAVVDPRSADEIGFDQTFAAGEPSSYSLNWSGRTPEVAGVNGANRPLNITELAKLDQGVRAAMQVMGLPVHLGGAIFEGAFDDAKIYSALDATSKQIYDRQQIADLNRTLGEDEAKVAISDAKIIISLLRDKSPALFKDLSERGLFNSARFTRQLHLNFGRIMHRGDLATQRTGGK